MLCSGVLELIRVLRFKLVMVSANNHICFDIINHLIETHIGHNFCFEHIITYIARTSLFNMAQYQNLTTWFAAHLTNDQEQQI